MDKCSYNYHRGQCIERNIKLYTVVFNPGHTSGSPKEKYFV